MNKQTEIVIFDDNPEIRRILAHLMTQKPEFSGICRIPDETPKGYVRGTVFLQNGAQSRSFEKPVRLGAVFDGLRYMMKAQERSGAEEIPVGPWMLDPVYHILQGGKKGEIKLTEKESQILQLLHAHTGVSVPREALLKSVWAYAENVETHTLETHIYRLRQKIEKDPADPLILLTTESGYQLV